MGGLGFSLNPQLIQFLPRLVVLLICISVHEFAHGYVAYKLGDNTAANMGRLTLNPIKHFDLFGSLALLFIGFGWAKPVPVNPRAFRNPRRDFALVAAAGPLSNIIMAIIVMSILRVILGLISPQTYFHSATFNQFYGLLFAIIHLNLVLAVFNMLPVPPLDGSRILYAFLPDRLYFGVMRYERIIMIALIALLFMGYLTNIILAGTNQLLRFVIFITQPISMILGG